MRAHIRRKIVANRQQRGNFLKNRVLNDWYRLPDKITTAISTNAFGNKLDKFQLRYYRLISTDWELRALITRQIVAQRTKLTKLSP